MAGTRAALYIRVSSDEQAKHGLSLDEQKHDLREYAIRHGYTIAGVYMDEGTTARKSIQRRKELQRLLQDVEAEAIDVILFIKLDRWFRNIADYYKVQAVLDAHKVDWIAIHEDYNTNTSAGRLNLNIRLSIAQNESDQTSDRIKFVFEGKKRRREVLTGNIPYGYKIVDKHFDHDKEQAAAIRDIFEHFLVSQSVLETTTYAREKHGIMWRHISMRRALQNERYIGTFYDIPDYTRGIVDKDTFHRVQQVLTARRMDTPRKPAVPFLFSGLIYCPECGHVLIGCKGHKYANQTEYKNKFYRCGIHSIEKTCHFTGAIFERPLERYLLDNLKERLTAHAATLQQQRKTTGEERAARKIKAAREALDRLKDLYVTGYIDRAAYDTDFKKYNKQLQEALKAAPPKGRTMTDKLKGLLNMDIVSTYNQLSLDGKRKFWHAILYRIDVEHYEKGRGGRKEYRLTFL